MNERKKNGKKYSAGKTTQKNVRKKTAAPSDRGDRISSRSRRRAEEARRRRRIQLLVQGIFVGFCVCLLCFSIYQLASIFMGYRSGEKEYEELKQYVLAEPAAPGEPGAAVSAEAGDADAESSDSPVPMSRIDLDSLQEINSEAIGWIEIPDTIISYPMVHSTDNRYYLSHTFRKESNKSGSIFLETSNSADFSDLHTIIYGHNMKNGSMFAGLKDYSSKSYLDAHPYIYIDLADGSHCYQIFSCHEASVSDNCYTIGYQPDDIYAAFLESMQAASLYDTGVEVGIEDYVVTLSTCTKNGTKRFVVHARKIY